MVRLATWKINMAPDKRRWRVSCEERTEVVDKVWLDGCKAWTETNNEFPHSTGGSLMAEGILSIVEDHPKYGRVAHLQM